MIHPLSAFDLNQEIAVSLLKSVKTAAHSLGLSLAVCLASALSSPSWAQDFDAGLDKFSQIDYAGALKEWQPLAEQGDAKAQYYLGLLYAYGLGDQVKAAQWYRKASEQGHADAQYTLGEMYAFGHGVQEDRVEQLKLYHKAAEQGHAQAQVRLGSLYHHGARGAKRDTAQARKWLSLAAKQGDPDIMKNVARLHREIALEEKEVEDSKKVLEDAQRGNAQAQFRLARAYAGYVSELGVNGSRELGIERNRAEAFKWYLKAAEQGHAEAQFQVAQNYRAASVEERDMNEVLKWYRRAAAQGHEEAKFHLGLTESHIRGQAALKEQAQKRTEQTQKRAASQKPPTPPSPQSSTHTDADAREDANVAMELGTKAMQGDRLALERLRTLSRQGNPRAKAMLEITETTLDIAERRKR